MNKLITLRPLLAAMLLCMAFSLSAQTPISGVVNNYAEITAFNPCPNEIVVGSAAGFSVGDAVLIVQMKGASLNTTAGGTYGDVTSFNSAGLYERAVIAEVVGNELHFEHDLVNTYDVTGHVQVVRIAQYTNANVTATLSATPWNGLYGGVLAIEVSGTLTLNEDIDISGTGFRGGDYVNNTNSCNWITSHTNYFYADGDWRAGYKGEGVADHLTSQRSGRGHWGNGGGGGNDHNTGGGGGANATSGGNGGDNDDAGAFNCHGYSPGIGGGDLGFTSGRVFLGGGAGSGHRNNNLRVPGGNGGGLIYIQAATIEGNGYSIITDGTDGGASTQDGAGGGGAGGSMLLDVFSFGNTSATLQARGGTGGNASNDGISNRCFGPGGGGSGGMIVSSTSFPTNVAINVVGGSNGITVLGGCAPNANNATPGAGGIATTTGYTMPSGTVDPVGGCALLPIELLSFDANSLQDRVHIEWATTIEIDNDYFVIERSIDGHSFEGIITMAGAGNSTEVLEYEAFDLNPVPGVSYYRLRQYDYDGTNTVSEIVAVKYETSGSVQLIKLYPNPTSQSQGINIDIELATQRVVDIEIIDQLGRVVAAEYGTALGAGISTQQIELNDLAVGTYLVRLSSIEGTVVRKFSLR